MRPQSSKLSDASPMLRHHRQNSIQQNKQSLPAYYKSFREQKKQYSLGSILNTMKRAQDKPLKEEKLVEEINQVNIATLNLGYYYKQIGDKYKGMDLPQLEEYFASIDQASDKFIKELYGLQQAAIEAQKGTLEKYLKERDACDLKTLPDEIKRKREKEFLHEKMKKEFEDKKVREETLQKIQGQKRPYEERYTLFKLNKEALDLKKQQENSTIYGESPGGKSNLKQSKNMEEPFGESKLRTTELKQDKYLPRREGHHFYKQQQLALLIPGYVDFILKS